MRLHLPGWVAGVVLMTGVGEPPLVVRQVEQRSPAISNQTPRAGVAAQDSGRARPIPSAANPTAVKASDRSPSADTGGGRTRHQLHDTRSGWNDWLFDP